MSSGKAAKMKPIGNPRVSRYKAMNFDPSSFVMVSVGEAPESKNFLLHEGIVCARSRFFRRAMTGNWIERDERLIKLPADDPELFGIYVNLVYTNTVMTQHEAFFPELFKISIGGEYITLSKLYALCEKLQDTIAKNNIVKAIIAVANDLSARGNWHSPPTSAIATIYQGTVEGNPARRLMVDLFVSSKVQGIEDKKTLSDLPKDFFIDLVIAWHKRLVPFQLNQSNKVRKSGGVGYLEETGNGGNQKY